MNHLPSVVHPVQLSPLDQIQHIGVMSSGVNPRPISAIWHQENTELSRFEQALQIDQLFSIMTLSREDSSSVNGHTTKVTPLTFPLLLCPPLTLHIKRFLCVRVSVHLLN